MLSPSEHSPPHAGCNRAKKAEPEFSAQLLMMKLTAKGSDAVRPIVWAVSVAVMCVAAAFLWRIVAG